MLPPLPYLHTLGLDLPLSADEITAVLLACPAVEDLSLEVWEKEQRDVSGALTQLQLVGRACPRVRRLHFHCCVAKETRTENENAIPRPTITITTSSSYLHDTSPAADITAVTSPLPSSSSSRHSNSSTSSSDGLPRFAQLIYLNLNIAHPHIPYKCGAWSGSTFRQLAAILHAAFIEYLDMGEVPLRHVYHLHTLSHLRALYVSHSSDRSANHSQYFQSASKGQGAVSVSAGSSVMDDNSKECDGGNEQIDGDVAAAVQHGTLLSHLRLREHMFVAERLSNRGANGREAFFAALRVEHEHTSSKQRDDDIALE